DTAFPLESEEQKLLGFINEHRLQNGRSPLGPSLCLTQASDFLSRDMAAWDYTGKIDKQGRGVAERVRDYGYLSGSAPIDEDCLVNAGGATAQETFELWRATPANNAMLLTPFWKVAGVARTFNADNNRWHWNVTFAAYWDATVPLPGEDEEGRIDRNELIRTRPPSASLLADHRFSGYGDDGRPYSPVHCDLDSNPQLCWRDPPPQGNPRLDELSAPGKLIGAWKAMYTINQFGIVRANYDPWDRTGYAMELQFNADGTWKMQGYRALQTPPTSETGAWTVAHDTERNEEVVTFIRQGTLPRATIRIHAVTGQLTFFALDGGGVMKNFLRGIVADDNNKDDPQILFVPKQ
ncbi:MAG TPA: hypothetical protein PKA34_12235, partial [Blastocatellia bacterium]|nr:hypothetical protein [Blastocatellia bacterium]